MVDQLAYLSTPIACTTTRDQACLVSCKPRFSSDTWLAYAMVSSSCSGPLVSAHHCSLFVTFIDQSSVSKQHYRLNIVKGVYLCTPNLVTYTLVFLIVRFKERTI